MSVSFRELAAVAEPADVSEVCCRLLHPGHPRVVDQGEGDAVLAQQRRQIRAEPAPVAHLDSVARPLRQGRQEILEHPHPLYGKGRRKLEEKGTEPIFEGLHSVDEAFGLAAGIDEVSLVRHLLRKLRSEEEALRGDLTPLLHRRAARGAVEGRVYLDGRVVLRVLGEPGASRKTLRVQSALPVGVGPAGGPEVKAWLGGEILPGFSAKRRCCRESSTSY